MLASARLRSGLAVIVAGMLAGACSEKHDDLVGPLPLDPSEIPPSPTNVVASVSASNVTLTWQISNPAGVREYRVYRSQETPTDFEYLASTGQTAYSDQQVVDGVTYHYQIAAVKGALEGSRSSTVGAVPNVPGGPVVTQ